MLRFVVAQAPTRGDPRPLDRLLGFEFYDLVFVPMPAEDATGEEVDEYPRFSAPEEGWTPAEMCRYSDRLACGDAYLAPPNGRFILLASRWVGSTEI